jgi:hypothetical protein
MYHYKASSESGAVMPDRRSWSPTGLIIAGSGFTLLCGWFMITQKDALWGVPAMLAGVLPIVEGARRLASDRRDDRTALRAQEQAAEKQILRAARDHGGRLSAVSAALRSSVSIEEAERILEGFAKSGHAVMNITLDGRIEFEFPDLLRSREGRALAVEDDWQRDRTDFEDFLGSLETISKGDFFEKYASMRHQRMFALFDASWVADRLVALSARAVNLLEYVLYERFTSVMDPRQLHYEDRQVLAETASIMNSRMEAVVEESRRALLHGLVRAIGNSVAHLEAVRPADPPAQA